MLPGLPKCKILKLPHDMDETVLQVIPYGATFAVEVTNGGDHALKRVADLPIPHGFGP
ncbi:MAG TPA: hypothetical protein VL371_00895 [Gemmataceae bacterium]|jgi:hypothetical protein|nr:hypothetical protein [Gemmataceae bacterium]